MRKGHVFGHMLALVEYAIREVPFYREFYGDNGFAVDQLKSFDDIERIPVVTKADLQAVPVSFRTAKVHGAAVVNTGGSSGQPLEFSIRSGSMGHEWAHMHYIWATLGYRPSDLKLSFSGRGNFRSPLVYDGLRHQICANTYIGWGPVADALVALPDERLPDFIHGYPSAIFDFCSYLVDRSHPLLERLRHKVRGLLLGSEYPNPTLRAQTEDVLGCGSISWYGHTERAILAADRGPRTPYVPMMSYGFAEAVRSESNYRLIGTAYHSLASPFIRYDTGDSIDPQFDWGLLTSFEVREGRVGEFILDRNGSPIFLTALIFGRHHALFESARYIQVRQSAPGLAEVIVVPRRIMTVNEARRGFDSSNAAVEFVFTLAEKPFRTSAGKVPLLVRDHSSTHLP